MEVFAIIVIFFSPLVLADSLFNEGDYFNAITEYKRAVYLKDNVNYALFKIGLSYEKRGKYDFAARYFGNLAYNGSQPEVVQHLAYNLVQLKKYRQALLVLEGENDSLSKRMRALVYGLSGNFNKADSLLNLMGYRSPHYPDNALLRYPSYIVPGFGLFLLGEYRRGVLSLIFTSASGYLTYYLFRRKRYPEGIVALNTLFFRFYFGNIENALKIKRQKKLHYYRSLLQQIYN